MTLSHLTPILNETSAFRSVLDRVGEPNARVSITDLPVAARPAVAAAVLATRPGPALLVTARADRAEALCDALNEFLPPERPAVVWPAPEALPYEQLPFDLAEATRRVTLLDRLRRQSLAYQRAADEKVCVEDGTQHEA